ncbi:MAG: thioredoxin family protein [Ignavibacteria bacterium]
MKSLIKILIALIFIIQFISNVNAQDKTSSTFKIITDEKSGKPMLIGLCTKENLTKDTSFSWWFEAEYDYYSPDSSIIKLINLDSIKIVCVMGTWCSDSRREVPRFFKILDNLKFNEKNLTLYCVDRKKQADGFDIDQFVIERVPTFILYKNDSEIGRIIETPQETLEKDILNIIKNNNQE